MISRISRLVLTCHHVKRGTSREQGGNMRSRPAAQNFPVKYPAPRACKSNPNRHDRHDPPSGAVQCTSPAERSTYRYSQESIHSQSGAPRTGDADHRGPARREKADTGRQSSTDSLIYMQMFMLTNAMHMPFRLFARPASLPAREREPTERTVQQKGDHLRQLPPGAQQAVPNLKA